VVVEPLLFTRLRREMQELPTLVVVVVAAATIRSTARAARAVQVWLLFQLLSQPHPQLALPQ
jgi:hypothetical protein